MSWGDPPLNGLVGRRVLEVHMDETHIVFVTDEEPVAAYVWGDCCSTSYFHDLIGFDKLLAGPVVSVAEIPMESPGWDPDEYEDIKAYGYEIVTDHPEFGEVTTVLSFRNSSNGYYGGDMESCDPPDLSKLNRLAGDVLDVSTLGTDR